MTLTYMLRVALVPIYLFTRVVALIVGLGFARCALSLILHCNLAAVRVLRGIIYWLQFFKTKYNLRVVRTFRTANSSWKGRVDAGQV